MNMERLTKRDENGNAHYPYCYEKCDGDGIGIRCQTCDFEEKICDKLAEYEDLEEQGLLLKLPCKVGDTVYVLVPMVSKESTYREEIVSRFEIFTDSIWICFKNGLAKDIKQIGKTVFLTEREAQSALEKMKGE